MIQDDGQVISAYPDQIGYFWYCDTEGGGDGKLKEQLIVVKFERLFKKKEEKKRRRRATWLLPMIQQSWLNYSYSQ